MGLSQESCKLKSAYKGMSRILKEGTLKIKKSILGASVILILIFCTTVFARDNSPCNLISFPNKFTALEDKELQSGDLLVNEEGVNEFKGCTKTVYGKSEQPLPRHAIYHLGQKIVAYKMIATSDVLSLKIQGVHSVLLFFIQITENLQGGSFKDFTKEELLTLEAFAIEMEKLQEGENTGITIKKDLRVIASRSQDTIELELLPLKTFLAFKRAGLK